MKIGFWNRLAIVAGGLLSIGSSSYILLSTNIKTADAKMSGYRLCINSPHESSYQALVEECQNAWLRSESQLGWYEWLISLVGWVAACLIAYAIIWLIVWTVKWIWRGRSRA